MSSFWPGGSKTKEQRLETALRFFRNWTRQRMVNNHSRENRKWLVGSITWQLVNSLHQNLVNGNCSWLEKAGNSNNYNVCKTDSPVFLASLLSLTLRFQLLFDCSRLLEYAKLLFCSLQTAPMKVIWNSNSAANNCFEGIARAVRTDDNYQCLT